MRAATIPAQTKLTAIVARIFLSLAWRSFALTRCGGLPADVATGVTAILNQHDEEQTA